MLVIPNTTTVASEQTAGFASFPPDTGALTPFIAGYLFVANASAQVSIRKGPQAPGAWTPYALVSPTLVPLSTDRGGRKTPDYIWGVKAIDAVAGTHAQVFGALFQAGEAGFVPSAQFGGAVSPSGGFTPGAGLINGVTGSVSAAGAVLGGSGFTVAHPAAGTYTITYGAAFGQAPIVLAMPVINGPVIAVVETGASAAGFTVQILVSTTGANADEPFYFAAIALQ